MTDILERLIKSASGTLTKLTKIRCVESYPLPSDYKPNSLFSWPNTRYIDNKEKCFLEAKGVFLRDNRVKTYSVPYSLYSQMRKIDTPLVAALEATRALLDVFQIVSFRNPVTGITAVWDTAEDPSRAVPTLMSDTQGLRDFGTHRDSFLIFHREGENYDIKLRPSVLPAVLQEKPDISGYSISHRDLREFVGVEVDRRGRKNRNIIFQESEKYFSAVAWQTSDAIEKIIGNNSLANEVKRLYQAQ